MHMCVWEGVQRAVNMVTWGLGWESGKVFWMNGGDDASAKLG